jgi:RimJ/RimL family protein N-acetyltransferase
MNDFPVLVTERLRLRCFEQTDIPLVHQYLNDPQVAGTLMDITPPYSLYDALALVAHSHDAFTEGSAYLFAVARQTTDELIGYCDIEVQPQHRRGEIAYWIGQPHWRQGYATEAARRVVRFGFETLRLNRIYAHVLHHNTASAHVLRKAGLQYEGTYRQGCYKDGQFADVDFYGILYADWLTQR